MTAVYVRYGSDALLDVLFATVVRLNASDADRQRPAQWRSAEPHTAPPEQGDPAPRDDDALFLRLRAGDRNALDTLYRATYADLWQFAFTYVRAAELADEVVQDVFIALMTHTDTLPRGGTIRGYLFASVRNRALNALRSARRSTQAGERLRTDVTIPGHGAPPLRVDDDAVLSELRHRVARAVHTLPERQQRAVLLRYAAGLAFPDIATALGISPDAARMLVNRATTDLRERLAGVLADFRDGGIG